MRSVVQHKWHDVKADNCVNNWSKTLTMISFFYFGFFSFDVFWLYKIKNSLVIEGRNFLLTIFQKVANLWRNSIELGILGGLTVIAVTGNRYAYGDVSILPSASATWSAHSSAASSRIQCNVYNNFVSALPRLKLDSFLHERMKFIIGIWNKNRFIFFEGFRNPSSVWFREINY